MKGRPSSKGNQRGLVLLRKKYWITFLDKYNPEQFEILGLGIANLGLECGVKPYKPHHKKYKKEVQHKGQADGDLYMVDENDHPVVPYARILIRKKVGA